MSLLTEQEIRSIMRSVKEIGENSDRALILATESTVIEKIKAQGPSAYLDCFWEPHRQRKDAMNTDESVPTPLYKLPEGD